MNSINDTILKETETIKQITIQTTQNKSHILSTKPTVPKLPSIRKRNLALIKNSTYKSFKSILPTNCRTISHSSSTINISEPATHRKSFITAVKTKQKELTPSNSISKISKFLPKVKKRNCLKQKKITHQELPELYNDYLNDDTKLTIDEQKTLDDYIPKTSIPQKPLLKLYNMSSKHIVKKYQIKKNNNIALRNDFGIENYQTMLLGFVGKNTRKNYLIGMKDKFSEINKIGESKMKMKSNWQYLLDKIENKVSKSLILKLQSLACKKVERSESDK